MKILFITSTYIGDAIISTTILNHFLTLYPHARLTIACGPLPAPIFEDLPQLEKLIVIHKKKYSRHWLQLWQQTVRQNWDIVIDLRKTALAYFLMACKRLVWHSFGSRQTHHEQYLKMLGTSERVLPKVWVSPQRVQTVQEILPTHIPVIALAPAANWVGKEWPQERYVQLIQRLTTKGGYFSDAQVMIIAAPHEYERLTPLIRQLGKRLINLPAPLHLLDVAALLQKCTIFIGNDSGLMHLAAAMGTLTLGLFGPTDDRLYQPTGSAANFIRTTLGYEDLWKKAKNGQALGLMDSLSVDMVIEKVGNLVDTSLHTQIPKNHNQNIEAHICKK